jgi:hypothetical protein
VRLDVAGVRLDVAGVRSDLPHVRHPVAPAKASVGEIAVEIATYVEEKFGGLFCQVHL